MYVLVPPEPVQENDEFQDPEPVDVHTVCAELENDKKSPITKSLNVFMVN